MFDPSTKLVSTLIVNEQSAVLVSKFDPSDMPRSLKEAHDPTVMLSSESADELKLAVSSLYG